jgi:hypothetical protein
LKAVARWKTNSRRFGYAAIPSGVIITVYPAVVTATGWKTISEVASCRTLVNRYVLNDPLKYTDPSGLEVFPSGVPSPDPGSVPTPLEIYHDLHDLRSQLQQEFGAGAANDAMRHCVASCIAAKRYGTSVAWFAGFVNEMQGLIIDITHLQTGAFQISDLQHNQLGLGAASEAGSESECRDKCKRKCPPEG